MKRIICILNGLIIATYCLASCASNGLAIFPYNKAIKQNSIFILEGYASSQMVIHKLNKEYPIYLKSGNKKIKLQVKEILYGQFRVTQAVLVPEKELEAGREYVLIIDNLQEKIDRYNSETKKYEPITYRVSAEKDNEKPIFVEYPKEVKKELIYYGCGPSTHVIFNLLAKDISEIVVKATVRGLGSNKTISYYIDVKDNQVKIGHGMCCGAFRFVYFTDYEIEFSLMDASGNTTLWEGGKINFTKPV